MPTNPTTPKTTLQRATSRKFLVTVTALVALYQTPSLDLTTKIIIAVVASVYVIGETVLDKGGQARILEVARAALASPPSSSAPSSGSSALIGALASSALPTEARTLLAQAAQLIDGATAGMPTPAGSQVPNTVPSPPPPMTLPYPPSK